MNRLITHGCSFTYGQELDDPATQAWPALLAKSLGRDLVNLAQPAYANDAIVQDLVSFDLTKDDLVIVSWTLNHRMIFFDEEGWYVTLPELADETNRSEVIASLLKTTSTQWLYERWLTQVVLLQNHLKHNNIPFLFLNTFRNYQGKHKLISSIDPVTFMKFKTFYFSILLEIFPKCEFGHPGTEAHQALAKILEKYMLENGFSVL